MSRFSCWQLLRRTLRTYLFGSSQQRRKPLHRSIRAERLEPRCLLASVSIDEQSFRTDQFHATGTFSYSQLESDYEDRVANGTFVSESANIAWSSPTTGRGQIVGRATAPGTDRGFAIGQWFPCSAYTTEETGRMDFSVNATSRTLSVTGMPFDHVRYTAYQDLTPGGVFCPQGNPWFRFFSGRGEGTFDPTNQVLSRNYQRTNGNGGTTSLTVPSTSFQFVDSTSADAALSVSAQNPPIEVPPGWHQTFSVPPSDHVPVYYADASSVSIQVQVRGKAFELGNDPSIAVAKVRLYWATAAESLDLEEILLDTRFADLNVFWNSQSLKARVDELPYPPEWANFLIAELRWNGSADAVRSNDRVVLRLARPDLMGAQTIIAADQIGNGLSGQLLSAQDATDSTLRTIAIQPQSEMSGTARLLGARGEFNYSPNPNLDFRWLSAGEETIDVIDFMAVQNGQVGRFGQHSLVIRGVNDAPIAQDDHAAAYDNQPVSINPGDLLANDFDFDLEDTIELESVATLSSSGARLTVEVDGSVLYNARTSPELYQLRIGESRQDTFTYSIRDSRGVRGTATVTVTVSGANDPPGLNLMATQYTIMDVPISIELPVHDGDDATPTLTISAVPNDSSLISDAIVENDPSRPSILVTPAPGVTGRTTISVSVQDPDGGTATESILLVIGSTTDLDLDGVTDAEEDRAPNQGDMNYDGIPDRRQLEVGSWESTNSGSFMSVAIGSDGFFTALSSRPSPPPSGEADGVPFPIGLMHVQLECQPGQLLTAEIRSDYQPAPLNTVFQFREQDGTGQWDRLMFNQSEGARILSDRVVVRIADGGIGDLDGIVDGRIQFVVALGTLANPWTNTVAEDVNNDGSISPIDALLVINAINAGQLGTLASRLSGTQHIPEFLDVSADGFLSAIDALIVINWLNN